MDIKKKQKAIVGEQEAIIRAIEHELSLADKFYKPQKMFNSVWFLPNIGEFMYANILIKHEIIKPLIRAKKLVYKGIEKHQGELMPRYILPANNN